MTTDPASEGRERRIRRAVARARAAMMFERAWRELLWPSAVLGMFLVVSWFGLWIGLDPRLRYALVAAFAAAFLASLLPLRRLRRPSLEEARHRVERTSGLAHRPLVALSDRPSGEPGDAGDRLWQAHQARVSEGLRRLAAGAPEPRRAERDPYAFRAVVLLLLVVSFLWAGPDWRHRIVAALDPGATPAVAATARLDAWISPPNYTHSAPIMLTGDTPGEARDLVVPAGSTLTVRSSAPDLAVSRNGEPVTPADAKDGETKEGEASGADGIETVLASDSRVVVTMNGGTAAEWTIRVTPDAPPKVTFAKPPSEAQSGALQLAYNVSDDYGVVSGHVEIVPVDETLEGENVLVPAPDVPLVLPRSAARDGSAQTTRDLTSHPWAGAEVKLTLVVTDAAGQEGRSETVEMTLPQRLFRDPLARAIVEQRRKLALDRTARDKVAYALEALTLEPEKHIPDTRVFLGLRSAYWRLDAARDTDVDALRTVVDQLWEVALRQEDGDMSLAAENLRRAQENLARALDGDASDEEISRLMDELRQALNEFMRELAMQAQNMPQSPMDPNARMLSQQDLNRMLDQMENMAKQGSRDAARQMLSQLQNMLENLRSGNMAMSPQQQQMGEMLNRLNQMIQQQQQLMDKTFDAQRRGEQGNGRGDEMSQLSEQQQALQQQLREMMKKLGQLGQQGQDGQQGQQGEGQQGQQGGPFGEADDAMGEAAGQLGQGQSNQALSEQGRALESLRRGAQSLSQQMQPGQQGPGMAGQPMGPSRGRADPLGRPVRTEGPDFGDGVEIPDQMDAARARRILEELRRRLSDPLRPTIEHDYLERLLERN